MGKIQYGGRVELHFFEIIFIVSGWLFLIYLLIFNMNSSLGDSEAETISKLEPENIEIVKLDQEDADLDPVGEVEDKKRSNEELDHDAESVDSNEQPLSKRQKKKLLKQQKYDEIKKTRKMKRKERQKLRREQRKQEPDDKEANKPFIKYRTMASPDALPLKVAIDLSFDHLMSDKDINKLTKQLQRCYSLNRRAVHPLQLYFTSFGDKCKKRLDDLQGHYMNWDVHIKTEDLTDVFPKGDIIYLSSDSSNVLREIDMSKTYVIGGLVDHNHHKGLCYNIAVTKGIGHAQLPLNEFLKLTTRTVLTVNHVFEIIMYYMESKDWSDAFYKVMPQRKITPKVRRRHRNKAEDGVEGNVDNDYAEGNVDNDNAEGNVDNDNAEGNVEDDNNNAEGNVEDDNEEGNVEDDNDALKYDSNDST